MIDQEVASRVAAFQGNPQALQQKYAASQELIDLLALQKIKSMKEAAAREMQMQMAQQQAANGESNATVAQQREKEVMDMTKQELVQQRGDLAQQQQQEQQQAMQKLMGGIASAPGAASAMEPKAMAAGGIVAFKTGDEVEDPERKRKEGESLSDYNNRLLQLELETKKAQTAKRNAERENERQRMLAERGGAAIPPSRLFDRAPLPTSVSAPAPAAPQAPQVPQADRLPVSEAQATMQAGPQAAVPPPAPRPPAPMGERPPAPPRPQQQGLGGLPNAQMGPPEDTLQNALRRESIAAMSTDPRARQLEEEARVEGRLKLTPEQRAVYDEGIAGLKKFYDQDFDPEMQRREGLKRYLLGMGGRSMGEFAGGAGAAMDYDTRQRAQQRGRFGEMQKAREGLIGLDRAAVTGGIEGGYKAYEQGEKTKQAGLSAGANMFGTETQSKDNAAMREIERLKIASTNAANAATRESTDLYRMQQESTKILRYRAEAIAEATKIFTKQMGMIDMMLQGNPKDANALKQKQALELKMEAARDAAAKPFDLDLARVEAQMFGGKGPIAGAKVEKLSK